jgi:hypothetical protein
MALEVCDVRTARRGYFDSHHSQMRTPAKSPFGDGSPEKSPQAVHQLAGPGRVSRVVMTAAARAGVGGRTNALNQAA